MIMTATATNHVANSGPAGRRILVAEDQADARESLMHLLSLSLGLPVDGAADGSEAWAMLQERPYAVLLTDLRMPKLHGMKLIEEVAAVHPAMREPVIKIDDALIHGFGLLYCGLSCPLEETPQPCAYCAPDYGLIAVRWASRDHGCAMALTAKNEEEVS